MQTTPRGAPYAGPNDPNDLELHTRRLAEWVDERPGVTPLTTAQRDALPAAERWNGRTILNFTTGTYERWDAAASTWRRSSVLKHGDLTDRDADDHPHYLTTGRGDARYLPLAGKAADADKLDGIDSTGFAPSVHGVHGVSSVNGRSGAVTGLAESGHGHTRPYDYGQVTEAVGSTFVHLGYSPAFVDVIGNFGSAYAVPDGNGLRIYGGSGQGDIFTWIAFHR